MKKAQKTQIKKFLTQELKKKVLPFLKLDKVSPTVEKIYQKTMEILPKLLKQEETPEENLETKKISIKTTEPDTKIKPSLVVIESNYSVLTPKLADDPKKQDKKPAVLSIPAYKTGKFNIPVNAVNQTENKFKVKTEFAKFLTPEVKTTKATVASQTLTPEVKTTKATVASETLKPAQQIKAKFEPNAQTAGGSESAKIVTLKTDKPGKKEIALVGEAGKEIIDQDTGSVIPVEMMKRIRSEPKVEDSELKILATDGLKQQSSVLLPKHDRMQLMNMVESGQLRNTTSLAEDGTVTLEAPAHFLGLVTGAARVANVASKGMKAAGGIAKAVGGVARSLAKTGLNAAKAAAKQGSQTVKEAVDEKINKVQGLMASVSGGGSGGAVKVAKGESQDLGSELEKQRQSSAQFSAMQQSTSGLKTKETTDEMSEAAEPAQPPQAQEKSSGLGDMIGGALKGVGSVVGAVGGGLASGLGAAAMMNPGFALMKSLFGSSEEEQNKEKKATVVMQSGGSTVNVTNIAYQYDVYKKTAEDSFMLPNYRREYG